METIRHVALGCCVISTIAGMIRVFWPKNGFSAVINAVLVLYIVTAGLQMLRGADWKQLTAELYHMPAAAEKNVPDYTEYSRRLGAGSFGGGSPGSAAKCRDRLCCTAGGQRLPGGTGPRR